MTELDALLAEVAATPEDDLPRLVLADWLEEREACLTCAQCKGKGWYSYNGAEFGYTVEDCEWCRKSGLVSNGYAARAKYIRLSICDFRENGGTRTSPEIERMMDDPQSRCLLYGDLGVNWWSVTAADDGRGFITDLFMPLADARRLLPRILACQPLVSRVGVTDREPIADVLPAWFDEARQLVPGRDLGSLHPASNLPSDLMAVLPVSWEINPRSYMGVVFFNSRESAELALSDALLAEARLTLIARAC